MKNIVICVDLNQNSLDTLKNIKPDLDFSNAKVHLVHVFEIHMYNADIVPVIFPTEIQYPEIKASTLEILSNLAKEIGIKSDQVLLECFFSHSVEDTIKQYLTEKKADLAVVSSREKHGIEGFFSSSLVDFLCKYSPCNVMVIRPKKS